MKKQKFKNLRKVGCITLKFYLTKLDQNIGYLPVMVASKAVILNEKHIQAASGPHRWVMKHTPLQIEQQRVVLLFS